MILASLHASRITYLKFWRSIPMGILILPSFLITTGREAPKKEWGVRVAGNHIVEIGPNAELKARYPDDLHVDGADQVLAPGFVNAHVHLYGVLAHGIPLPSAS